MNQVAEANPDFRWKLFPMMLIDPVAAFGEIDRQPRIRALPPLVAILSSAIFILVLYYQFVDLNWLVDSMLAKTPASQQEAARRFLTRPFLMIVGSIGTVLSVIALDLIMALYYFLFSKVQGSSKKFGDWFTFVVWTSAPSLLLLPIGAFVILTSGNGQVQLDQLNPTNLNNIFFHIDQDSKWFATASSVSIVSIWNAVLMVIGVRVWTKISWFASTLVGIMPTAIFYAAWMTIMLASGGA